MPRIGPDKKQSFILVSFDGNKLLQTDILYYNLGTNVKSVFTQYKEPVNHHNKYYLRTEGSGQG